MPVRAASVRRMVAPTVAVLGLLFGGGLLLAVLQTIGVSPFVGRFDVSLAAYRQVAGLPGLWASIVLTVWVATASTVLSLGIGVSAAVALRRLAADTVLGRATLFLFQANLTVPHVVAAVGAVWLLSQSGLLARAAFGLGLISGPQDFPALVYDRAAIGTILAYVWKEVPFVGVVTLSLLASVGDRPGQTARSLGATRWQAFRHVTLPQIRPGLIACGTIIFAFALGTYEVPALTGASQPKLLPVLAYEMFTSHTLADRPAAVALSLTTAAAGLGMILAWRSLLTGARR